MFSPRHKTTLLTLALSCSLVACTNNDNNDENNDNNPTDMGNDIKSSTDMKSTADMNKLSDMTDMPIADMKKDSTSDDMGSDMQKDMGMQNAKRLRLATWNIYYLDTPGAGDKKPRQDADYTLLQKYNTLLAADIVALQEINGKEAAATIFKSDQWDVLCEDRNSRQNVCLANKKSSGWVIQRNPDVETLRADNPNLRAGIDVTISQPGYSSMRLLVVHMKADCYTGTTAGGCATYFKQITALEQWIDARAEANEPFIVTGDFNRFMTDTDSAWTEIDDAQPTEADLTKALTPGNAPTPCWGGMFPEYIDHIILGTRTAPWLKDAKQLVFEETDFNANYETLSDHCPVWADLDIPASN